MEWEDFHYSPLMEESMYSLISSPSVEWTCEENKLFENALAEMDPASPAFLENVASRVPWKSIEDIRIHYQALIQDLEMIETDQFSVPNYPNVVSDILPAGEQDHKKDEESSKTRSGQQRRRGVPWTEEEHQLFLMGLNKYGKGDWRSISRYYVITKTPTQVASHAQKYFRRQTNSTPIDRRRPSIHDIQTVNPNTLRQAAANIVDEPIPFSSSHNFNGGVIEQNPMFLPTNFPSGDDPMIFRHTSGSNYSASYLLSSLRNQRWG